MATFAIGSSDFLLDGRPLRIISGAMHYFRSLPEQYAPRLRLLRGMGLNTIETYVAWNVHEPEPGRYVWNGLAALDPFLDAAAAAGLYAIVRPGPFICAEWDNGGLPAWLLADRSTRLRCYDRTYLNAVDRWFDQLIPRLAARQVTRGGNVLMLQVENEYGSYGTDRPYLEYLANAMRVRGIDVPLFTSDGPTDARLSAGTLPGVLATVNFGSAPKDAFTTLRAHQPTGPLMCMEYWNGWFDHWGEEHHTRSPKDAAQTLDEMLAAGASVNIYMAHGGTNFGFRAGANRAEGTGELEPTITSYDYDAPLDEAGRPTAKYWAYQEVIGRYLEIPSAPDVRKPATLPEQQLVASATVPLAAALDQLGEPRGTAPYPRTFEEMGLAGGLGRYRCRVRGPRHHAPLLLEGLADEAFVWCDGEFTGSLSGDETLHVPVPPDGLSFDVVVAAYGRTNFGAALGDRKGVSGARHGEAYLHGWQSAALPLDPLPQLPFGPLPGDPRGGPRFWYVPLRVGEPADGFLALPGWNHGMVWVNGFCLGRYDVASGPQRTLYIPGPLLRPGDNAIVVLELTPRGDLEAPPTFQLRSDADLG
ncbi:MAG: beta-galactosidase [Streptosporangiales bacterium]